MLIFFVLNEYERVEKIIEQDNDEKKIKYEEKEEKNIKLWFICFIYIIYLINTLGILFDSTCHAAFIDL